MTLIWSLYFTYYVLLRGFQVHYKKLQIQVKFVDHMFLKSHLPLLIDSGRILVYKLPTCHKNKAKQNKNKAKQSKVKTNKFICWIKSFVLIFRISPHAVNVKCYTITPYMSGTYRASIGIWVFCTFWHHVVIAFNSYFDLENIANVLFKHCNK